MELTANDLRNGLRPVNASNNRSNAAARYENATNRSNLYQSNAAARYENATNNRSNAPARYENATNNLYQSNAPARYENATNHSNLYQSNAAAQRNSNRATNHPQSLRRFGQSYDTSDVSGNRPRASTRRASTRRRPLTNANVRALATRKRHKAYLQAGGKPPKTYSFDHTYAFKSASNGQTNRGFKNVQNRAAAMAQGRRVTTIDREWGPARTGPAVRITKGATHRPAPKWRS